MKTLRIRADKVNPEQHSALVQALRDAGIRQEQLTIREGTGQASGPALYLAAASALAAVGMLGAWVWAGDWRWGLTAALALGVGFVAFGLSISKGEDTRT